MHSSAKLTSLGSFWPKRTRISGWEYGCYVYDPSHLHAVATIERSAAPDTLIDDVIGGMTTRNEAEVEAYSLLHFFHLDSGIGFCLPRVIVPQESIMCLMLNIAGFNKDAIGRLDRALSSHPSSRSQNELHMCHSLKGAAKDGKPDGR